MELVGQGEAEPRTRQHFLEPPDLVAQLFGLMDGKASEGGSFEARPGRQLEVDVDVQHVENQVKGIVEGIDVFS